MKNSSQQINESQEYLAALDIGSNSFHFVLARKLGDHLQVVHTEKYRVQLAQGLNSESILDQSAIERGLSILAHLATTTRHIHPENFRAVATFTLRKAKNVATFLTAAKKVFPFEIEIISGHEEARLIYQGVAHHRENNEQQLIIDIGGGSTECIIGERENTLALESLNIGCVSYQQRFFPTGEITSTAFKDAIHSAKHQIDTMSKRFKTIGWQQVIGTSGTIKTITKIINFDNNIKKAVTLTELIALKKRLLQFKHQQYIKIAGLKENRQTVICSGVAILIALLECLEIRQISFCKYALREGVLFEQLANSPRNNVRANTINGFVERFNIDKQHAKSVSDLADKIFNAVKATWQLTDAIYPELLHAAISLHEIGMNINASGYQKHGQYILEQTDLAGFNQEQQKALAWLVGNQRNKISPLIAKQWHLLAKSKLEKLCFIIRLSVLLNQQRHGDEHGIIAIDNEKNTLIITLNTQWLLARPIIDTELFYEQKMVKKLACRLKIQTTDVN